MTNTTYYNLNIVEGTDIVNPLTVDNPNYEKIDETMHNNAVSGVTLATEIANATVHAITRENSECAVIRFIATSAWKAGDTITVDGVPVTALLPSGETLPDGAYVINSNVLCILTGTNMTVFAERKKTDNANDIKYNGTNVGAELDKVNNNMYYKLFNNTVGIEPLPLPSSFNELLIVLEVSIYQCYSFTIPKATMASRTTYWRAGGKTSEIVLQANAMSVNVYSAVVDGVEYKDTTAIALYYK